MFGEIPRCVVEESRALWRSRTEPEEDKSAASSKEKTPVAEATPRQHESKHVCLFTEEQLSQPAPARKNKLAPAEGVSFF